MAGMERHLLGLGEEVVRVAVQRQASDPLDRHDLLRDDLRRIEEVEVEVVLARLLEVRGQSLRYAQNITDVDESILDNSGYQAWMTLKGTTFDSKTWNAYVNTVTSQAIPGAVEFARYADSNGYTIDGKRSIWPWRDWLISAFNKDMPFDQFTIEQIAGDLLPNASIEQRVAAAHALGLGEVRERLEVENLGGTLRRPLRPGARRPEQQRHGGACTDLQKTTPSDRNPHALTHRRHLLMTPDRDFDNQARGKNPRDPCARS